MRAVELKLFMVIIDPLPAVASELFAPILSLLPECPSRRSCPSLDDFGWITVGVQRCLMTEPSGRGFLQSFSAIRPDLCPEHSLFFEALKSRRRLSLVSELNRRLCSLGRTTLPDRLACFPCLEGFDVYASDGHFHEHACHDRRPGEAEKLYPVGHLYSRDLRTGLVSHLALSDHVTRKKEHEIRTLKRLSPDTLRQGAPRGRKVIHVYDRAAIDFRQWFRWKQGSGVYIISRSKENMALEVMGELPFDRTSGINAGVTADELTGTSNGVTVRRVTFHDVHSGRSFEYLTTLTDSGVPPGIIAQLYKMRWDIEKSFDEIKNKLGERKAWAASDTAKEMQAQFICVTLNLVTLLSRRLEVKDGLTNTPEAARRKRRSARARAAETAAGLPQPTPWQVAQGATQHSVKLYRWVAARMWLPILWHAACDALRILYAQL
jgi:Transposase DDE domain